MNLSKFLHLAYSTECNLGHVTSMAHIVSYMNKLRQSGVGPLGQITKLQTLLNAVKMIMSVPDDGTKDMVVRTKVIETKIKGISKNLR